MLGIYIRNIYVCIYIKYTLHRVCEIIFMKWRGIIGVVQATVRCAVEPVHIIKWKRLLTAISRAANVMAQSMFYHQLL